MKRVTAATLSSLLMLSPLLSGAEGLHAGSRSAANTLLTFSAWPSDEDIIGDGTSMLSRMYEDEPIRVIFQVSDSNPDSWPLTLNNARVALKELSGKKPPVVEIVAYGPGIEGLRFDSALADRVKQALESGIKIVACENTMKAQRYTHDDMLPNLSYVPAGAVEIIQKQKAGYVYVRP